MRKLIASAVCAFGACLVLSQAALAQEDEGDRVCRAFVVHGVVQDVGDRSLVVSVERARPEAVAGEDVKLRIGSRTRMVGSGQVVVGSDVRARGTVCQVDEADEAVFYTKRVKVKRVRAERVRGPFELTGTVTGVTDEGFTVDVSEASFESIVGASVAIAFRNRTTVEGEVAVGVVVDVAGRARTVGGESGFLANAVTVADGGGGEPPPPDEGE